MSTSDADLTPTDDASEGAYVEPPPIEAQAERRHTRFDSRGEPLDEAEFYCPACGRRYEYRRECTGTPAAPHAPVEVVSTDELQGDPEGHTAAPASE